MGIRAAAGAIRALIFAVLVFAPAITSSAFADELYSKDLGPVSVRGQPENYEILVNGQVFARDTNTWLISISDGFPTRDNPKWVLLSYSSGGNCCAPTYRMLDVGGPGPRLSEEFGNMLAVTYLNAKQQVIFDFQKDVWVYGPKGLSKMPALSSMKTSAKE